MSEKEQLIGQRIGDSPYLIEQYVSGGAFGQIYLGIHEKTQSKVAVKMERRDAKHRQLYLEFGFYQQLGRCEFMPKIYTFGPVADGLWHALVMDLLGPSLMAMFSKFKHSFTLRCTSALGIRLMQIFEYVHDKGLIYRDVKPENFLMGRPGTHDVYTLFLIDLGLMKHWQLPSGEHIPFAQGKCITGTPQFMSLNMHKAYELSRRDDLQAVMYMLVYLHKGTLPWLQVEAGKDWKGIIQKYGEIKDTITPQELCSNMTNNFTQVFDHIIKLEFEEEPDYQQYIRHFNSILKENRISMNDIDKAFDWDSQQESRSPGISSSYNSINNKSMRDNRRNQRSQRRFSQTSQKKSSRVETRRIRNKKGSRKKKR
ncbi:Casein kinase I isoform gamma-2 [Blomia tropicalis]|nr:Casein kinase I isoform gamma-2 [Blomia tropicalis]